MEKNKYEILQSVKTIELRKLRDLTTEVFSKIGTEKSRQRLVYDLLNSLKSNNRERFMWLILKNVNTLSSEKRSDASEYTKLFSRLCIEYETPENFEKMAYAVVMGIMSIKDVERGDKSEQ